MTRNTTIAAVAGALSLLVTGTAWLAHEAGQKFHPTEIQRAEAASVHLSAFAWVNVQNPDGAGHGHPHGVRQFGESCSVDAGDTVQKVGGNGDQVLVRIESKPDAGYGALCPEGTLFYMDASEYAGSEALHLATLEAELQAKAHVIADLQNGR